MENMAESVRKQLDAAGLGGLARSLDEVLLPLRPVLANLLWMTQPAFALFGRYEDVGLLAEDLAHPAPVPPLADDASPD